uniref:NADH-ubiquinone oxidoreductase chain 2 n=1 Tax=Empoascanara falcata TaxID=3057152 RepID=A0AA51NHG1_9HEMI|nr:NADH dehydrogenase subunit 2 [Empoascanara falcata]WMQ53065.1 NADH dehydrogenase subunit 2 [Empoascanara falcata]
MKLNSSKVFFLSFMIVGVMICLCSNNWLFIWCGLELSLITLLPLMRTNLIITSESMMKYFLIQSISSGFLIIGLMLMISSLSKSNVLLTSSLLLKMGVAPFHSWLISVIESLEIVPLLLALTISKIAPLMILSFIQVSLSLIIMLTLMCGSFMGLTQTNIKKILTYSSIFNMGLILSVIKNNFIWLLYLTLYSILLFMLMMILWKMNSCYVNQLIHNEQPLISKFSLWINLLSMGGIPPMLGFSIKLIVIEFLVNNEMALNLVFIILTSTLTMFFYLRISYLILMFNCCSSKWLGNNPMKLSSFVIMINFLSTPFILMSKILI